MLRRSLAFAFLLVACGSSSASPGGSDPGAPGADGQKESSAGSCVGYPSGCDQMVGLRSCIEQTCDWSTEMRYCRGVPRRCEAAADKDDCFKVMGCGWKTPGGAIAYAPGGTCSGQTLPCEKLAEDQCTTQVTADGAAVCQVDKYYLPEGIVSRCLPNQYASGMTGCDLFTSHPSAANQSHVTHWRVGADCAKNAGCTWQPD